MVYVLAKDKTPPMPTGNYGHIRWLLKHKKALVVSTKPFTVRFPKTISWMPTALPVPS